MTQFIFIDQGMLVGCKEVICIQPDSPANQEDRDDELSQVERESSADRNGNIEPYGGSTESESVCE